MTFVKMKSEINFCQNMIKSPSFWFWGEAGCGAIFRRQKKEETIHDKNRKTFHFFFKWMKLRKDANQHFSLQVTL